MVHLNQRDTTLLCVSRTSVVKINDFGVSFTAEQQANGAEHNFRWPDHPQHLLLLDRAPKGRDEDNIPPGRWWWRRHDDYEQA